MSPNEVVQNEHGDTILITVDQNLEERSIDLTGGGETAAQLADSFIATNRDQLGLALPQNIAHEAGAAQPAAADVEYSHEREVAGSKIVIYDQKIMGLPIFNARLGVHIDDVRATVTSAQSSMHSSVVVSNPDALRGDGAAATITKTNLKKLLPNSIDQIDDQTIHRQVVYRYDAAERVEAVHAGDEGCFGGCTATEIELSDIDASIEAGRHYIVDEVLFEAAHTDGVPVRWRALIEPDSGQVLYLRALVANATGLIYQRDPQTQNGSAVSGTDADATLNPFRTNVTLPGMTAGMPQPLSGEFVEMAELGAPVIAAPVGASPGSAFNFDVTTDEFSAVNAYYHSDNCFRTMEDFGFNVASYFDGTTFPVPIDHRCLGGAVNAQAPGNATGDGLRELRYGLLAAGTDVGIATSNRVVWHEFGHALLWDHVSSPNFGFAHSAGDALGAILNDPGSGNYASATDPARFLTFPWVNLATRRHDRAVSAGWAWFGSNWNTQYGGEQVLSTTMFRFYRSIGGDALHRLSTQRKAADATAYLIFKAIGTLTSTTSDPTVFVTALQNADLTTASFQGTPGGALHKVVRWAFEKQGLFQPGAAPGQPSPVTTEGNPPDVDVYINDGREGEYEYLRKHWKCQDIWVRRNDDGGLTHQRPIVGTDNYIYVRVKNRGMTTAVGVRVSPYTALPGSGLAFPDDWQPTIVPSLGTGPIAPGAERIVGPFRWRPTQVGHECLMAIAEADGDPGNDTTINGTIAESRFVPFDNNIGQRNVNPLPPLFKYILEYFHKHPIWVRNPFKKPVVCKIEIGMPKILEEHGWKLRVVSAGRDKFELGPREKREVMFTLEEGNKISDELLHKAIKRNEATIEIETTLDGELSGGMSYPISFDADEGDDRDDRDGRDEPKPFTPNRPWTIEEILRILGGRVPIVDPRPDPVGPIGPVGPFGSRVKTVRLEFDLDD